MEVQNGSNGNLLRSKTKPYTNIRYDYNLILCLDNCIACQSLQSFMMKQN